MIFAPLVAAALVFQPAPRLGTHWLLDRVLSTVLIQDAGGGGGGTQISAGVHTQGTALSSSALSTGSVTTQASGSVFVVACSFGSGATFTSITDSKSNTYVLAGTEQSGTIGSRKTRMAYCNGGCTGGASHTWTCNTSTGTNMGIIALELKDAAAASVLDQASSGIDSASPFTQSITTVTAISGIVTAIFTDNLTCGNDDPTANGYTLYEEISDSQFWCGGIGAKVVTSAGAQTASWTSSGASNAHVHVLNIKD